ncbi:MAG: hypothetical protein ACXADY_05795 [Candidatus Hodarchaeales archaeon]
MKLAQKSTNAITRLKLKSGTAVEIHIIDQDNGTKRLVIEKTKESLALEHGEISDFLALFNDFLDSI